MSCTFYVLPAREVLGRQFAGFLTGLFPGLDWTAADPVDLAETLTALAEGRGDVFVVHRDELPDSADLEHALASGFGADKGDLVVEVAENLESPPTPAKLWRVTIEVEPDDETLDELDEDEAVAAGAEE
jgi:hypothetical protein